MGVPSDQDAVAFPVDGKSNSPGMNRTASVEELEELEPPHRILPQRYAPEHISDI